MDSGLDDEEYDRLSDYIMSETDSDVADDPQNSTPLTAASTPNNKRSSNVKKLVCPYDNCSKTFNRQARLHEHLRSHTNTRPFQCAHCAKAFLRSTHLKHHLKSAHSDVRDHTCSRAGCGKSFATGTRLRRHEATHVGHDRYRCTGYDGCDQSFRKRETLNRHILQVHEHTKPFRCEEIDLVTGEHCKKAFDTAHKLKSHQRSMHDPTKFSCTICVQKQSAEKDDRSHIYDNGTAYFPTYAALKSHVDSAHPPTCAHCLLPFKTSKELSRHEELVHSIVVAVHAPAGHLALPKEALYPCPYAQCDRCFSKKGNLTVHIRTVHEKRRDFVCGQTEIDVEAPEIVSKFEMAGCGLEGCGRDFTSKSTLREHIRTTHLGLQAKRVERNKRRQMEEQVVEDEDELLPKKRRTRKDKGVKKTSAIQSLVEGFPVYRRGSIAQADAHDSSEADESDTCSVYEDEQDAGLTGSMVMHGSHIFHRDATFHFDSSSSSLSLPTRALPQPIYQPVDQAGALSDEQSHNLNFHEPDFEHAFDLPFDPSLNLSSTPAPLDLHQQSEAITSQQYEFDLPVDPSLDLSSPVASLDMHQQLEAAILMQQHIPPSEVGFELIEEELFNLQHYGPENFHLTVGGVTYDVEVDPAVLTM